MNCRGHFHDLPVMLVCWLLDELTTALFDENIGYEWQGKKS
ncbi:hypothetical protein THTE_0369 [Thermogutta terrifontis]|uniref:Uncharacterized protein n=1 Tax=Thermogutta terrifontis TaxID=1331910 RepID=A0A286RAJ3_9BACT|nr:hypothetical protein THTE_0369 [Thermogutta terrifontis]